MRLRTSAVMVALLTMCMALTSWGCDPGVHAKVAAEVAKDFKSLDLAFVEGFASHIALDYVNYGTTLYFDNKIENKSLLPVTVALNYIALKQVYDKYRKTKNKKYLYAAIGGLAPDILEALYRTRTRSDDDHLFPWHNRRSTLLFSEPSGAVGQRAAKVNIALTVAVYQIKF